MESKRLMEILEDAGYELRSYSGRGMYGDVCVAFTIGQYTEPSGVVAEIVSNVEDANERKAVANIFKSVKTDSMGMGTIVYFPRMKWVGDE